MLDQINITGHLVLTILVIILAPFALVWALNTLFPILQIEYSFETWIAVVIAREFLKTGVYLSYNPTNGTKQ